MISHFFGGVPRGFWNLSSLTWDQTQDPWQWECGVLTAGPPGNSHDRFLGTQFIGKRLPLNFLWILPNCPP